MTLFFVTIIAICFVALSITAVSVEVIKTHRQKRRTLRAQECAAYKRKQLTDLDIESGALVKEFGEINHDLRLAKSQQEIHTLNQRKMDVFSDFQKLSKKKPRHGKEDNKN